LIAASVVVVAALGAAADWLFVHQVRGARPAQASMPVVSEARGSAGEPPPSRRRPAPTNDRLRRTRLPLTLCPARPAVSGTCRKGSRASQTETRRHEARARAAPGREIEAKARRRLPPA
jgi:hypothetical protein